MFIAGGSFDFPQPVSGSVVADGDVATCFHPVRNAARVLAIAQPPAEVGFRLKRDLSDGDGVGPFELVEHIREFRILQGAGGVDDFPKPLGLWRRRLVYLEKWMRAERARLSRHAATAQAIDYILTRWPAFTCFLDDGRICLTQVPQFGFEQR